ncbi:MAG: dihydrofolate reductase [Alphaproteobacteria bacterium]|nr:dihydrofolate reductase [Alphaproteobacteria bacterium]
MTDIHIAFVVAIARNGAIGIEGGLPWRLPGDLAFFKRTTMGKPILMGRKTWESLPRKPLPGRPNLIVTRDTDYKADGAEVFSHIDEALNRGRDLARDMGVDEVSIIGGAEIYRQTLPVATRLYITEVDADPKADTFFPDFDRSQWQETWREAGPRPSDPAVSAPDYSFVLLTRQ